MITEEILKKRSSERPRQSNMMLWDKTSPHWTDGRYHGLRSVWKHNGHWLPAGHLIMMIKCCVVEKISGGTVGLYAENWEGLLIFLLP